MQKLKVSIGTGNKESIIDLTVLRTFQDAGGTLIHLLQGGDYGYRDGAPIRTEAEFNIIGDRIQREAAIAWFRRRGKRLAEEFYTAQEIVRRRQMGDFVEKKTSVSDTDLDQVLYVRYPADNPSLPGTTLSWMEAFASRPDWWGQADTISFADWIYKKEVKDSPPAARLRSDESAFGETIPTEKNNNEDEIAMSASGETGRPPRGETGRPPQGSAAGSGEMPEKRRARGKRPEAKNLKTATDDEIATPQPKGTMPEVQPEPIPPGTEDTWEE